mmetsp:Transcript_22853/g.73553  ORF Transcript_22853/g.73553 Transcript_22853/m.73553 type:complete len:323 (-) Transcript_22853:660-1628(-)
MAVAWPVTRSASPHSARSESPPPDPDPDPAAAPPLPLSTCAAESLARRRCDRSQASAASRWAPSTAPLSPSSRAVSAAARSAASARSSAAGSGLLASAHTNTRRVLSSSDPEAAPATASITCDSDTRPPDSRESSSSNSAGMFLALSASMQPCSSSVWVSSCSLRRSSAGICSTAEASVCVSLLMSPLRSSDPAPAPAPAPAPSAPSPSAPAARSASLRSCTSASALPFASTASGKGTPALRRQKSSASASKWHTRGLPPSVPRSVTRFSWHGSRSCISAWYVTPCCTATAMSHVRSSTSNTGLRPTAAPGRAANASLRPVT